MMIMMIIIFIVDGDDVVKMFLKNDLEEMFWEREPWEKSLQIGRRLLPRCRFYQNCSFYQDDHGGDVDDDVVDDGVQRKREEVNC